MSDNSPKTSPYGSWKSPITSESIVQGTISLGQVAIDGGQIYWTELRPAEAGRIVLVRTGEDGSVTDVTPAGFNVRTRVHEYGGGAFLVEGGVAYFSNFSDQRLYRQAGTEDPVAITPEAELRYADGVFDRTHNSIICVREDHTDSSREAVNTLVRVDAVGDEHGGGVIASGCDFYAAPRLSPDGRQLAWLQWNHPNLPWDGCELCVAERNQDGSLGEPYIVAGGSDESILQPLWSPRGTLHFISDRSNWWNLYRWRNGQVESLCPKPSEFGGPMWLFGQSTFAFDSADSLLCVYSEGGQHRLSRLSTTTGESTTIDLPLTSVSSLQVGDGFAAFVGGSPTAPTVVARLDLSSGDVEVLRQSSTVEVDRGYLSVPQPIEFPTENDLTAHAFYYPPANQDHAAPNGELPPLLVRSHGGPTSATTTNFSLGIQYWTSRGFAFLDVNYGGSTGYGREYRQRLAGQWGVVDVDDCANGALYLAREGKVDGDRLAIDGGSAGGYTTLCALAFRDDFKAGASHFGLSDLTVFVGDTHKFESRYLDSLVGPYPEKAELYKERSAINHLEQFNCPVIFFQGDEDKIVPPNQAELMVDALREKGIPVAYLLFEGEQHGFRKAENIKRSLDGEFYFFSRIFGFEPADEIEPVEIENL